MTRSPRLEEIPAAAPPRIADWLAAAPDGPVRVLHACADVVHLDVGGRAVGLAAKGGAGLPNTLRTSCARVTTGAAGTPYLECGLLHLGGRVWVIRRLVDVRAPRLDAARAPKTSPVAALGTPRPRDAGLVAVPGIHDRVDPATVTDLVGRGEGLTPFGDDVLCGWLAAHRAAGVQTQAVDDAVRRALPRTTTLSATLLECALAGEVADLAAAYLRSLGGPAEADARAALTRLGHSSGEGLAHGIDLALVALADGMAA